MENSKISLLGKNIKKIRKNKELSIFQLSKLSNVSSSTISQIETGGRNSLKSDNLEKIAVALEVTPNSLLLNVKEEKKVISNIYESIIMDLSSDKVVLEDVIMTANEKEQFKLGIEMIVNAIKFNRLNRGS